MEKNVENTEQAGVNQLEQVFINMPEVRFYFSGDREQSGENLEAYLGNERLEFCSLQRVSEGDTGIRYYLLLDVSASISEAEFGRITEALSEFSGSMRPQDQMSFLTFGEDVVSLFDMDGAELAEGKAAGLIGELKNQDQKTLLFEAVQRAAEEARNVPVSDNVRCVIFVITDGEDIAEGKATKEEALQTLQKNGIPVYGFTMAEAKRDAVNAFGEFSRATGGYLTILDSGSEKEGFEAVRDGILQSYEAVFSAGTNQVSHETVSAILEFAEEGKKQKRDVMQDRWVKDEENPVVSEVVQEGARQLRVVFSEPVEGTGAADNFYLEKEGQTFVPAYASPGSGKDSVVLTFSDDLAEGGYHLICSNITDCSMERNALEQDDGAETVWIEGAEAGEGISDMPGREPNLFQEYGWAAVLLLLVLLAAGLLLWWKNLKKRKVIVTVEGKAALESNVRTRHHVSMEEKKWEERQLFFHVQGQREEIPVTIRKSMIVGRASACELIFDDPALSRQHFALELKEGKLLIRNLSRSGFTAVNGIRLGDGSYALNAGDEIGAGQIKMTVRW